MKLHIDKTALNDLDENQKQSLRDLWVPEKHDLAVAFICKDAENEIYDEIGFVVGEVTVDPNSRYHNIILRSLRLLDDNSDDNSDDNLDEESENDQEESFDMEYIQPEDYFRKEYCLPLFSIGQLIDLLRVQKYGMFGYSIDVPGKKNTNIDDIVFSVTNSYEEDYSGAELCDALWEILKLSLY
jgi:hypothetical protein